MKCFNGLAVVGVLVLLCGVVLGQGGGDSGGDGVRNRFNWRDFFNVQGTQPSTPKSPNFKDTNVNYGSRDNLFDVKQFANDIIGLEKGFIGEEELDQLRPKARKLPADLFCKKERKEALETFCTNLKEGEYYDPWNPFCGFILCTRVSRSDSSSHMLATRELCRPGTWVSDRDLKMRHGRDSICRVALPIHVTDGDMCTGGSMYKQNKMCEQAKRVLQMNDKTEFTFKSASRREDAA